MVIIARQEPGSHNTIITSLFLKSHTKIAEQGWKAAVRHVRAPLESGGIMSQHNWTTRLNQCNEPWLSKRREIKTDMTDLNHRSRHTLSFKLRCTCWELCQLWRNAEHNRPSMKQSMYRSQPHSLGSTLAKWLSCLHGTNARTQTYVIGRPRDRACPISYQMPSVWLARVLSHF